MKKHSNILESKLPWRYLSRLFILTTSLVANSWAIAALMPYQKNMTAQKSLSTEKLNLSFVQKNVPRPPSPEVKSKSKLPPTEERSKPKALKTQSKTLTVQNKPEETRFTLNDDMKAVNLKDPDKEDTDEANTDSPAPSKFKRDDSRK